MCETGTVLPNEQAENEVRGSGQEDNCATLNGQEKVNGLNAIKEAVT